MQVSGAGWKVSFFAAAPPWAAAVMARGFKTPAGVLAIVGLMGAPLWAWACRWVSQHAHPIGYSSVQAAGPWTALAPGPVWLSATAHALDCARKCGLQLTGAHSDAPGDLLRRHLPGTLPASPWWALLLVPGRALAGAVEAWVLASYMAHLLDQDSASPPSNPPTAD